jgi:hypothetical protein
MNPRKEFLLALFRILDRKPVPYCVLRNYANIYENTLTDVDIAVEPEQVLRFKECLAEAAAASNHHLVLRARYTNYSYVYWHPKGRFIRIDVETEVRWHVFPILTAKAVVGLRRREGAFYIPHPRHESAVLWVASIWRDSLSDRYREQLARLYAQAANPREFPRTFNASFGAIGEELAACQSNITSQTLDRRFWKLAKRSIVRNAFRDRPWRRALLGYLVWDVKRLWERLWHPRGISILYASAAQPDRDLLDLFQQIQFLYPVQKTDLHSFALSPVEGKSFKRLGFRLRARRLFVLFKGGLFMRFYRLSRDSDIPKVLQTHTRYLFPSCTFIWTEDSQFHTCLGHVGTGFMAEPSPLAGTPVPNERVVRFIADILEQYPVRSEQRLRRRGAFVVLAGLDASSRSAVARSLCSLALADQRFNCVRCLRWPPHLGRESLFPLRELDHLPDWPQLGDKPRPSRLPILQVCMNLLLAHLGLWLRLRPLLRRDSLVLFDGYDYEYLLDPTAVKGFGRARLLARLLSLYPRPDMVVVLKAPAAPMRSGNQALSEEETLRQTAVFEQLRFDPQRTLQVDASSPPLEIARAILQKIAAIVP